MNNNANSYRLLSSYSELIRFVSHQEGETLEREIARIQRLLKSVILSTCYVGARKSFQWSADFSLL